MKRIHSKRTPGARPTCIASFLAMTFIAASARASTVYVAQSAGTFTGGNACSGQTAVAAPYTAATPGMTVYVCGVISANAGAGPVVTIGASGASGAPTTVLFDVGAKLTAPYWTTDGAIKGAGVSYVVVDGGSNGEITATANGTQMTYSQSGSMGVVFEDVSDSEIKNLTISSMYVHDSSLDMNDTSGGGAACVSWNGGSNNVVDGNTMHDCYVGVDYALTNGASNAQIHDNTIYDINWGVAAGDGSPNDAYSGIYIHDNVIHDWLKWDTTSDTFHHDGIFIFAQTSTSTVSNAVVYNNRCYGQMTGGTACIYNSAETKAGFGVITGTRIFNNVLGPTSPGSWNDSVIFDSGVSTFVANNTIIGNGSTVYDAGFISFGDGAVIHNNVLISVSAVLGNNWTWANPFGASDYNDFFGFERVGAYDSHYYATLADWQTAGFDLHSSAAMPGLDATSIPPYQLTAPSGAAYASGMNLTSDCAMASALCSDALGRPRPATGPWDMGAYAYAPPTAADAGPATQPDAGDASIPPVDASSEGGVTGSPPSGGCACTTTTHRGDAPIGALAVCLVPLLVLRRRRSPRARPTRPIG